MLEASKLFKEVEQLRFQLEKCFSTETAYNGLLGIVPSTGHCSVVAIIVHILFGGMMCSTKINNQSHWFNIINGYEVDLTGDQFGLPSVQISSQPLYGNRIIRKFSEINDETLQRAKTLLRKYLRVNPKACPFGKNKDIPWNKMSKRQLMFYKELFQELIENEDKKSFLKQNKECLKNIQDLLYILDDADSQEYIEDVFTDY